MSKACLVCGVLILLSHYHCSGDLLSSRSSCPPPSPFSDDAAKFQEDLMHISCTTLSSKILTQHRDLFARLAVEAVLRLKGSGNLDAIKIMKKLGGNLRDSYLEEGMYLTNVFSL